MGVSVKHLEAGGVFRGISQAQNSVGQVAVIAKTAVASHECLIVPVLQELMKQGVPVHPQGPADTLNAPEIWLASSFDVESHPISHTAEEGDPRFIFVQNLEGQNNKQD